jgi:dCTP deaminase
MILPDREILALCAHHHMINPYVNGLVTEGVISYGVSSFGYDARLAGDFKSPVKRVPVVDPKKIDPTTWTDFYEEDSVVLGPGQFVLGRTMEYFRMPLNVLSVCVGKSTYARCGIQVLVTPLEPGWHGHVTLEITNVFPDPVRVHVGEGICQFLFFRGNHPVTTYGSRKYQRQEGVTLAKV